MRSLQDVRILFLMILPGSPLWADGGTSPIGKTGKIDLRSRGIRLSTTGIYNPAATIVGVSRLVPPDMPDEIEANAVIDDEIA